ncbi:MAG: metal ABC transporter ATP-binding protein [Clostridia bacterium]
MKVKESCGLHCIQIKDIGVTINRKEILKNVNIHIHCGQLTTIIGKNGAGKSTLLKALLGEIEHTGEIVFTNEKNKKIQRIKIGYVPQSIEIDKSSPLSVYDLVASFITNKSIFFFRDTKIYENIKRNLKLFEADELIDKRVCDLSGGQLQRVLLTIAIYNQPNLLILDEPVSGIDKNGMELFYKNIDMLKKKYDLAVILVSHDLDLIAKYSDRVILLDKTIIKEGSIKEVYESFQFKKVFGGYARQIENVRKGGINCEHCIHSFRKVDSI